jgi:rhamnogalacturonyl hydrolase YesR
MLGIVRTLEVIPEDMDTEDLRKEFARISAQALQWQRADGLWSCFLDEADVLVDTSGSAGIAAAMATGIRLGILDSDKYTLCRKTWDGLQRYLTPDGLLTGIGQSNRGGGTLQRSDYRVMLSMGAGLAGQLYANLQSQVPPS